jgi:hypothetical protein
MNRFLGTTNFKENCLPILPIVITAAVLPALLTFLMKYRKKSLQFLSDSTWNQVLYGFRAFLFLTIQETMVIIYLGIRFSTLDGGTIIGIGIYCVSLVFLIVDCNLHASLPLFNSTQFMNLNFLKKLILPVLVVVPHNYTFFLTIFLIGFNLVDLLFLFKAKKARLKQVVYMGLELLCLTMTGGFLIADLGNNN